MSYHAHAQTNSFFNHLLKRNDNLHIIMEVDVCFCLAQYNPNICLFDSCMLRSDGRELLKASVIKALFP